MGLGFLCRDNALLERGELGDIMVVCMAFNDHDLLVSSMSSFASIGTIFE